MNNTKCPDLMEQLEWVILFCKKGKRPYAPTLNELQKYCKSGNYSSCRLLEKNKRSGPQIEKMVAGRQEGGSVAFIQ